MTRADWFPADLEPAAGPSVPALGGAGDVRRTLLEPDTMTQLARSLRMRATVQREIPVVRVIAALDGLHRAWAGPRSAWRSRAVSLLQAVTGCPAEVLDLSLRRLFRSMAAPALRSWLAGAGIAPEALDGAALARGVAVYGPELMVVVSSGNVPGAALPSVVQALLLKSPCLVKTSSAEPLLLPLYARSLHEAAPELARALVVTGWEGGSVELERALLGEAEALAAYGSDAALEALRRDLPLRARFLGYGRRISFAAVAREVLTPARAPAAARAAARDLCFFDQQGCLSPQAVYIERGGPVTPEQFCEHVARAMTGLEERWPRRPLSAAEAAAVHQFRTAMEMRTLLSPEIRLWSSPGGLQWTVALDPDPALQPCCLNRTAVVHPLDSLEELPARVGLHRRRLISAALGAPEPRRAALAGALAAAGVTRICELGQAQFPKDALLHDGINAVAALARFVVSE